MSIIVNVTDSCKEIKIEDTSWTSLKLFGDITGVTIKNIGGTPVSIYYTETNVAPTDEQISATGEDPIELGGLHYEATCKADEYIWGKALTGDAVLNVRIQGTVDPGEDTTYISNSLNTLRQEFEFHINDLANPHKVTKAQVGLGNIPNAISDRTDLDSDTTLATSRSVLLLKTDLANRISDHINNKENPHIVTKEQVGLGNIPNAITESMHDFDTQTLVVAKVTNDILKIIQSHEGNLNNPHNVTKEQLGIGDIPTSTTDSMYESSVDKIPVAKVTNDLYLYISDHVGSRNNPHNVTAVQINAAPLEHTHKVADITDIQSYLTKITDLELSVQTNRNLISGHVSDTENPHNVTYAQLGVGDIGTVFLNTGSANPVIHVPMVKRLYICETTEEVEKCKNNIPSMREMFNSWKRISHATTTSYPAIVTNPGGQPAAPSELLAWEYKKTENIIYNTTNSCSLIGLISPDKYTEYETEIIFNAKTDDDDSIGFIAAFTIDENQPPLPFGDIATSVWDSI